MNFTPFELRATAPLPDAWIAWLGAALRVDHPSPPDPWPAGFTQVAHALDVHGLLPLVYLRLRDTAGWQDIPAGVRDTLTAAFQNAATRSLLLDAALTDVTGALASAGVEVALLKGLALGRTVYGSPVERPVSDFDLLVPRAQIGAARQVLSRLGFRDEGLPQGGRLGDWLQRYRAETPLIGTDAQFKGLLVELHWTLLEMPYYIERIPMTEAWAGSGRSPLPGARLPTHAVLLIHAAAHIALHHSRDLRLIWLVDVDRLAVSPALNWQDVLRLAEGWNLGLALKSALDVAARWLGSAVPAGIMSELDRISRDPVGRTLWGLGDELPGRARRKALATLAALGPRARLSYVGWLTLRATVGAWQAVRSRTGGRPVG